jgi:AcrR family transcriptional regulator
MAAPPETRPPRKRLSAVDRRATILDSALEVFSKRGYNGASIDEIATAAGISKALIYEHFPSKRDLHVSLLEGHVQDIFTRLAQTADTDEPGEVRLRNGVNAFFQWVEDNRAAFRLLFRDTFESDVADVLNRLQNQATGAIAALMAAEPAQGAPLGREANSALAIEAMAQQLSGGAQSLAIWWQQHPRTERDWLVDRVMEYAWIGLERVRAGERAKR